MKLKNLSKEELESMSYDEIAYKIFEEENKKMKLPDLFKKICNLLDLDESEYENRIADFFQLISRDQRFTMLDKGYWDLKEKYKANIIMDNDEEEEIEESEDDLDINEDDESYNYDEDNEDDDVEEDDLKDLVIISDDEEDEANMA
ncbi:MAG: DNA-directed RNA polymerase subunit delta [Firmicutes bacterium]|nr:DNA-directed RNA polymerase subunit delta [Bacillota bacterium]